MAGPAEPRNANASSLIGKTIGGRYTIRAAIGLGGMGHVYRATQAPMNREVAIKVLRVDLAGQEGQECFKREARAASLIQHPNAITIFDFDGETASSSTHDGVPVRRDVAPEAAPQPILTVDQALDMFESEAGAWAPRTGSACAPRSEAGQHLPRRPTRSARWSRSGPRPRQMLDRAATGEAADRSQPAPGERRGYMAPEQALGIQPIDSRCDVYAPGLLLFEMLAQRAPFVGDDGMEVLAQRLRREAPRLQVAPQKNFSPQMTTSFWATCSKRDRDQRPQDANVSWPGAGDPENNQVYRPLDDLG